MAPLTTNLSHLQTTIIPRETDSECTPIQVTAANMGYLDKTTTHLNNNLGKVPERLQDKLPAISDSLTIPDRLLSPIKNVCPEILGEIFQYCTPPRTRKLYFPHLIPPRQRVKPLYHIRPPKDAALLLLQVCQRWRDVAQGTPQLWTDIPVYSRKDIPFAAMCLFNSGSVPFDITIAHNRVEHDHWGIDLRHCYDFAKILVKKIPSVRSLEYVGSFDGLTNLFPSGNPQKLSYLEELLLDCTNVSGEDLLPVPYLEATRLHTLTLQEAAAPLISKINPSSSLRRLALQMTGRGGFTLRPLFNFLRLCPGIEELELHSNSIFQEPFDEFEDPIILPALWRLEVDCDLGLGFISLLRAPNLLSAVFLHNHNDSRVIGAFLSDVRTHLSHLSLIDFDLSSAILHDSMKKLIELETLEIIACKTPGDLWLSLAPDEGRLANFRACPKLERLKISGTSLGVGFVELVRHLTETHQQVAQGGEGHDGAGFLLDIKIENCTIPHSDVRALQELQLQRRGVSISGLAAALA